MNKKIYRVILAVIGLGVGHTTFLYFNIMPLACLISYVYFLAGGIILWQMVRNVEQSDRFEKFFMIVIFSCLFLFMLDSTARPFLRKRLYYRAHEMFIHTWPSFPLLARYEAGVLYQGQTYGDLAIMTGDARLREPRIETFQTDRYGFRNYPHLCKNTIDLIVLGDSFGVSSGTRQDKIWPVLLNEKYNIKTYNLSIPGNPWQELMNLKIELRRLKIRKEAVVLWLIFMSNDLDEIGVWYSPDMDNIRFNGVCARFLIAFSTYRNRSPLRQLANLFINGQAIKTVSLRNVTIKEFLNNRKMLFYNYYIQQRFLSVEEVMRHRNYAKLVMIFEHMRDFAKENGMRIIVVSVPSKEEVYSWVVDGSAPWSTRTEESGTSVALKKLTVASGLEFFDLRTYLVEESRRAFESSGHILWWYDDTHWNELGNEAVASIIYARLLSSGR